MVKESIERTHYKENFIPCPDISGRQTWEGLPARLREALIHSGEQYLGHTFPTLTASDYMEFSKTGNRSHYEDRMFGKRRILNALVLAECTENKGRFLKDILNGIYSILEESTWCVPAHNTYIRDTPQEPLPDYSRPVVDLFAGETAAVLAAAEYLLRPVLAQVSPFISGDIDFRLRERIFAPYLERHFWWMGDGKGQMNNWTVWITQNLLLAAFTRPDPVLPAETKEEILRKAARSVDYFLDEYGEDGCCDEGAQYYERAGVSLYHCLDIMDRVTKGSLSDIFRQPKIRNIADYIRKVHIRDDRYINFADCSLRAGRRGAGEYLFGKRTGQPALSAFAAADFLKDENRLLTDEQNLYRRIVQIMHWEEMTLEGEQAAADESCPCREDGREDAWFESTGLLVSRDEHLLLAVKAGDNGDSHNHNDAGSFIICKDGIPLFIDLGVETYCGKTFSDRRYEIWTMQSRYHNLPAFGGFLQQAGSEFAASDVTCTINDGESRLAMELAGAYRLPGSDRGCVPAPDGTLSLIDGAGQIRSYTRSAALIKGEKIVIQDHYDGSLPAVLSLMTKDAPCIRQTAEDQWELSFGALAACSISGASKLEAEDIPLTDPKLRDVWGESVCRILVGIREGIRLEIR